MASVGNVAGGILSRAVEGLVDPPVAQALSKGLSGPSRCAANYRDGAIAVSAVGAGTVIAFPCQRRQHPRQPQPRQQQLRRLQQDLVDLDGDRQK